MGHDERFRQVQRFASVHGFVGGFPNFHEASYGQGTVYGTELLSTTIAQGREVDRNVIGIYHIEDVPGLFRAANAYAVANGFAAAYPNCEQGSVSGQVVLGLILINSGAVEFRDVPRSTLGVSDLNDVPSMMRAAHDYAIANGFAGGFPTFNQADYGNGVVYGVMLFYPGTLKWKDLPATYLARYTRPTKFAILLCSPSDSTPVSASNEIPFRRYFTYEGKGTGGAYDYWYDISYGTIDIGASQVFSGITLSVDLDEVDKYTGHTQRGKVYTWGREAAERQGINLSSFDHTIVVLNTRCDAGQVATKHVVLGWAPITHTLADSVFVCHEMGHALGISHSFNDGDTPCSAGAKPGEYCDKYDIMSGALNTFGFELNGVWSGPGACALNLMRLETLDPYRVWTAPSSTFNQVVTIAALNKPWIDEYLAAIFTSDADPFPPRIYSIEYREPSGWDQGLPEPVVLLHEMVTGKFATLQTKNTDNGVLRLGVQYQTPDGSIAVRLEEMHPDTSTVNVRIWRVTGMRIKHIVFNPPGRDILSERVILENTGVTPIDLTGWTLRDIKSHVFSFPSITIPPGFVLTVWTGKGNDTYGNLYWGRNVAAWNNEGDTAILQDANNNEVTRYRYN